MNCELALPLVPLYLDGELSENQADELRPHLLSCASCRAAAQSERSLRAWFVPTAAVAVPDGFAARVARRAFAGDVASVERPDAPLALRSRETPVLRFAMRAVAVAALVLLVVAIALRRLDLPGADLKADSQSQTLEDSLEALRRANQALEAERADDRALDLPHDEVPADGAPEAGGK